VRLGLLTGGGDCPGLNAALRAVVRTAEGGFGDEVVAFHHGWRGVASGESFPFPAAATKGILRTGGTVLGTARFHPHEHEGGLDRVLATFRREHLDALVVLGGDGTLEAGLHVHESGVPVVGIPKTIDNDVAEVDRSIGFDTALAIATEAVDRVQTTAESHDRLIVVEVMGREAGWLGLCAALAGGADAVCLPEEPVSLDELAMVLERRHRAGANASVVVVAEGARFAELEGPPAAADPDEGGPGRFVRARLGGVTGYEARLVVLGHVQRGGPPTATDRLLACRLGVAAVEAAHAGELGTYVSLLGDEVQVGSLRRLKAGPRRVPASLCRVADRLTVSRLSGW
jgi:6-phosphofructokinase